MADRVLQFASLSFDEHAEALAHHFSQAGGWEQAVRYGRTAAEKSNELLWHMFLAVVSVSALILFVLLRPVSRDLALLAVFFNLISITIEAVIQLQLLAALFSLGNAAYLSAFEPDQLYAVASLAVRLHGYGFGIGLIFFGCVCLVVGYLIVRSSYFPAALGVLMQIAGLSYLVNSFALLLAPDLASRLFPAVLVPAFVGEASFCGWLLVKGVDVDRWRSQAAAQPSRSPAATG